MSVVYGLKIAPLFFNAVVDGDKKLELRVNDRDYKCGDFLLLREWEGEYTCRKIIVKITHILPLDIISIEGDWIILSITHIDESDTKSILDASVGGV